jgi:hypothetical protein
MQLERFGSLLKESVSPKIKSLIFRLVKKNENRIRLTNEKLRLRPVFKLETPVAAPSAEDPKWRSKSSPMRRSSCPMLSGDEGVE